MSDFDPFPRKVGRIYHNPMIVIALIVALLALAAGYEYFLVGGVHYLLYRAWTCNAVVAQVDHQGGPLVYFKAKSQQLAISVASAEFVPSTDPWGAGIGVSFTVINHDHSPHVIRTDGSVDFDLLSSDGSRHQVANLPLRTGPDGQGWVTLGGNGGSRKLTMRTSIGGSGLHSGSGISR